MRCITRRLLSSLLLNAPLLRLDQAWPASSNPLNHANAALAAAELEPEQALVVDAWAVIQRAYFDPDFNGVDWRSVRSKYVKRSFRSMNEARAAVREMLSLLGDRYTRYVTPSGYENLLARFEARPGDGGIGVQLGVRAPDGAIELLSVGADSPAEAAGLRVGDVIRGVGGRRLQSGASAEDASALIIGPVAEPVRLELARGPGATEQINVSLTRAPLSIGAVRAQLLPDPSGGTAGVLTVPQFSDGPEWLGSLRRGLLAVSRADMLLIDLRGNPGVRASPPLLSPKSLA
jgi:carboxyl-terminal processing protease